MKIINNYTLNISLKRILMMEMMLNPKSLWMLWIPAGMILGITVGLLLGNMAIGMPIGIAAILIVAHVTRSLNRIFNRIIS